MKKSILIAVYNMEIGGIERSLINMLEHLDYEKYSVDLLIYHHSGELMNLIPKQVNVLPQIDKYSLFRKPVVQCIKEGYVSIPAARVISRFMADLKAKRWNLNEGPGYVQMQLALKYSSFFLPKLEKRYHLAISYAWPHDIVANKVNADRKAAWVHTDYSKLEIDNEQDLKVWGKFDFITAVSEECANSFLKQYPSLREKLIVIENLTSPAFIKQMASASDSSNQISKDNFNLLSVGRLSYVKGFDLAVQALKILHDKGLRNIKWYVVGYGGYEEQLKELINANDMQDNFILLGKKTNPYVYMNSCDLYVQPSRYEGKAVTVTEAMIVGKPILITDYPTSKSQVNNGIDGFICDLSVQGLAEGIEKLYHSKELRDRLINNIKDKDYSNAGELKKLYGMIS